MAVILAVITLNTVLDYVQAARAKNSLQALRDMAVARSRMRRDALLQQVARPHRPCETQANRRSVNTAMPRSIVGGACAMTLTRSLSTRCLDRSMCWRSPPRFQPLLATASAMSGRSPPGPYICTWVALRFGGVG